VSERNLRRRYVLLAVLHYFPVGVTMPVTVLMFDARGLSIGTIGAMYAVFTILVGLLELPTGGLADTWGRRPVLLLAAAADVVGLVVFALANSLVLLLLAVLVLALGQALYSGPLEAWYVDAVHADDARADVTPGLARGHSAQGLGLAIGALVGGVLPQLAGGLPSAGDDVLLSFSVPFLVAAGLSMIGMVAIVTLLDEPPRERTHVAGPGVMATMRRAISISSRNTAVRAVLGRFALVACGMMAFELIVPVRLEALTDEPERAASLYAVIFTAGMLGSAISANLAPFVRRRFGGAASGAMVATVAGGVVACLGAIDGVVPVAIGLLGGYLLTGPARPLLAEVIHREVSAGERATVLSAQSIVAMIGAFTGSLLLPALAGASTTGMAMLVGGLVIAAGGIPLVAIARRSTADEPVSVVVPNSVDS
jgi:predicted MFS family arabinose efflux permease